MAHLRNDLAITKAHELQPYHFGLLSVASVNEYSEAEDAWARYTAHEYNSDAFRTTLVTNRDATAYTMYNGIGRARFLDYIPFNIEVEDYASTLGSLNEDRFERVLKILEATTGKAVERELWSGDSAKVGTGTSGSPSANANNYLTKSGASTNVTVTSAGDNIRIALANLEASLAGCPYGNRGVIHMTRKTATHLTCMGVIERVDYSGRLDPQDVNTKGQALVTALGTPIIVGAGYSGDGPVGATGATATATTEWMFATGYVDVHLGAKKVLNEDLQRATAASTNDIHLRAARAAAVHFEPCCHYAVRVDLSLINNYQEIAKWQLKITQPAFKVRLFASLD